LFNFWDFEVSSKKAALSLRASQVGGERDREKRSNGK
jgi:hypothetical protein